MIAGSDGKFKSSLDSNFFGPRYPTSIFTSFANLNALSLQIVCLGGCIDGCVQVCALFILFKSFLGCSDTGKNNG